VSGAQTEALDVIDGHVALITDCKRRRFYSGEPAPLAIATNWPRVHDWAILAQGKGGWAVDLGNL